MLHIHYRLSVKYIPILISSICGIQAIGAISRISREAQANFAASADLRILAFSSAQRSKDWHAPTAHLERASFLLYSNL